MATQLTTTSTKSNGKEVVLLPPELDDFSWEHRDSLVINSEVNPRAKTEEAKNKVENVAAKIIYYDEDNNVTYMLVLDSLTAVQLRLLALKFGCTGVQSFSKFEIRKSMAIKKLLGKHYYRSDVTSSFNVEINTKNYMRVINGVFSNEMFTRFLKINDRKTKEDYEKGNGGRNEHFWSDVSNYVNDLNNHDLDSFMLLNETDEFYENYIHEFQASGFAPINCATQTGETCKAMILSVIKVRGVVIALMTESGQNANDPYKYVQAALKRLSFTKSIPIAAAYYFIMYCQEHPLTDSTLKRYLDYDVKADSVSKVDKKKKV